MLYYDSESHSFVGPAGSLHVLGDDQISQKLLMLIEGQCGPLGPKQAAEKFGLTKQRYYQLLKLYSLNGATALASKKRGPKNNYRRTDEAVRQVIRHRFLDPDASVEVIAQKMTQSGFKISVRSVVRVIEDFGLQKKTLPLSSKAGASS
jgi:transposase